MSFKVSSLLVLTITCAATILTSLEGQAQYSSGDGVGSQTVTVTGQGCGNACTVPGVIGTGSTPVAGATGGGSSTSNATVIASLRNQIVSKLSQAQSLNARAQSKMDAKDYVGAITDALAARQITVSTSAEVDQLRALNGITASDWSSYAATYSNILDTSDYIVTMSRNLMYRPY